MYKILFFTFLLVSSNVSYALQIKSVKDNRTVLVKISAKEQSRIFVYKDRILTVRGLDGAYDLKKDDKLGDIYIQPTSYYQHKAFNLFITTEQGHAYSLLATPLDIPAETIELKPLSPTHQLAARWEKNSPYQQTIINLIHEMINGTNPEGYAIINLGETKPKDVLKCFSMRLLTLYKGDQLQGEIWLIKNKAKTSAYLRPRELYQNNVLGVAMENEALAPGDETLVYRVVSYENE